MNLGKYSEALKAKEDFLLQRLYEYASRAEYTRDISTKEEEWRTAVREPARALAEYLRRSSQPDSFHVDEKLEESPGAAFGILEAKRHRERGVSLEMFLGLTKLVRQAFIDLVYEVDLNREQQKTALAITHRFFDKFELGFCSEWASQRQEDLLKELQNENRRMTNEKNRYHTIFQSLSEPIHVVDPEMNITDVNVAFERYFNLDAREIIGRKCRDVLNHELCEECPLQKAMWQGTSFSDLEGVVTVKGEQRVVLLSGSCLNDVSGKFSGGVLIQQDITESRRIEQELRRSQERLEILFDKAPDAYFLYDLSGVLVDGNRAAEEMSGYKKHELIGKNILEVGVLPPDQVQAAAEQLAKRQQGLPAGPIELRVRRKDGEEIFLEIRAHQVSIQGRDLVLGMARDITKRRQVEDALRKSEERFRALFFSIDDVVILMDPDFNHLLENDAYFTRLGFKREDNPEKGIARLHPDDVPRMKEQMRELLATGRSAGEYRIQHKDGHWLTMFGNSVVVYDESQKPLFVTSVMRDITEQKQAERRLDHYRNQLRSLASDLSLSEERERRRIAVELHDHVGQVLAMAKIKLGSLRKQISNDDLDGPFSDLNALCDQAIKFTRSLTFELSPPVLYDLGFEAALEWLADQHRARQGIPVDLAVDRRPKPLSDDVRVLLFQAVRELLVNVAKHARADIIRIIVAGEDSNIRVDVEDDGVGFDVTTLQENSGFGLFNIRERLELIDGRMELESEPGKGTRVSIVAPLEKEGG